MDVRALLCQAREETMLSQRALATQLGLPASALSRYESGAAALAASIGLMRGWQRRTCSRRRHEPGPVSRARPVGRLAGSTAGFDDHQCGEVFPQLRPRRHATGRCAPCCGRCLWHVPAAVRSQRHLVPRARQRLQQPSHCRRGPPSVRASSGRSHPSTVVCAA
ncbi:MAG: helix-turn-helix domain-containing protein [Actinobacteria bacterium]|nr:helix-turn-helix domain-containing protein [Actinomycetota bacterium]